MFQILSGQGYEVSAASFYNQGLDRHWLALHRESEIPPTAVGGLVQVLSTRLLENCHLIPPTAVGGYFNY